MCFWIFVGVIMAWADIYRDKVQDIPETISDSASYLEEPDIPADMDGAVEQDIPEKQLTETDSPFPDSPDFFKAEPAVLEAEKIIRGRSIAHFIPDGRVVR